MSSFEEIKATLKDKWLDYYQMHHFWIKLLMDSRARLGGYQALGGGKRPDADVIIGAITALEPKLALWMSPFCQLNTDENKLVEVLGLNFDPDIELRKRAEEATLIQKAEIVPALINPDIAELEKIRQQIREENSKK